MSSMKRFEVRIMDANDERLNCISKDMGLSLNLEEMQRIKRYFVAKKREPTDVELQSIAQAWSEHCCYKSSKRILHKFIFSIEAPQNILVIKDDAGVVEFDEDHAYVLKFESHNHPSAIEPYGGAATGIGGVVRDVVCMGAQPVALMDPIFFGPLDHGYDRLPAGVKDPRFLFNGVVAGIRDYGSRIGIPTCAGMVYFDDGYLGNCLVNAGCVGIMKKAGLIRSMANQDELVILVGGKTGRDGIHGVTFASVELTKESEDASRTAFRTVFDPIIKERLIHAILEASEKRLIAGMKDLGGGGLSCAVSEICHAGGCGSEIRLEEVKLREEGMSAWEIWVSESQERFLITARPQNEDELLSVFDRWDIDAVVIGETKNGSQIRIFYDGELVAELETDFLLATPVYTRPMGIMTETEEEEEKRWGLVEMEEPEDYNLILKKLLAAPNIASREPIIRQYDHEVRGATVIKPLQGRIGRETHGDAAVIKPLEASYKGIAITTDVNPSFCRLDPFWGAASAIDEVCRNLTAVGAVPHSFADCLNFGNPEKPEKMREFYDCCRGLNYLASALGVPFASGNVSFYNESAVLNRSIPPTPAVMGIGLCDDVRECVTVDVKEVGSSLYLIGETKAELGGSEYYRLRDLEVTGIAGIVPRTDPTVLKASMDALLETMKRGMIASCHDLSEGGLAVTVCEMLIGGDIGASIDITGVNRELRSDYKLFSESNSRWVVEVWAEEKEMFEAVIDEKKVYLSKIGETIGEKRIVISDKGKELVNLSLEEVRTSWLSAFISELQVNSPIKSL